MFVFFSKNVPIDCCLTSFKVILGVSALTDTLKRCISQHCMMHVYTFHEQRKSYWYHIYIQKSEWHTNTYVQLWRRLCIHYHHTCICTFLWIIKRHGLHVLYKNFIFLFPLILSHFCICLLTLKRCCLYKYMRLCNITSPECMCWSKHVCKHAHIFKCISIIILARSVRYVVAYCMWTWCEVCMHTALWERKKLWEKRVSGLERWH